MKGRMGALHALFRSGFEFYGQNISHAIEIAFDLEFLGYHCFCSMHMELEGCTDVPFTLLMRRQTRPPGYLKLEHLNVAIQMETNNHIISCFFCLRSVMMLRQGR